MVWTSAYFILVVIAFGLTIYSGVTNKVPIWIPMLLITVALLVGAVPKQ